MAIQLIGSANTNSAKWSFTTSGVVELGFNISSMSMTVAPEIDTPLLRIDGQVDGGAIGDPMGDLKMSGEALNLTTASNVTLINAYTAFVPQNAALLTTFGRSAGGWYLKSGEIKYTRGGWAEIDSSHKSHFNLA